MHPMTENKRSNYEIVLPNEDHENELEMNQESTKISSPFFTTVPKSTLCLFPILLGFAIVLITTGVHSFQSSSLKFVAIDTLSAKVTNEYSYKALNTFQYPFLEKALLMEPHRQSTVTISGFTSGCSIFWTLTEGVVSAVTDSNLLREGSVDDSSNGVFHVTPGKTGLYDLTIRETCTDKTQEKGPFIQPVWVKYVRRELESLNDKDREEFLNAYRTLWDVSTADGVLKYGKDYKSVYYLAQIHLDAGSNDVCDEFHEGAGFLNNHIYIGMYLEQSLRLVNPRVSLHYMEYSKYFSSSNFTKRENEMDGGKWTSLLTSKWFGSNDPYTGEIIDSRWAYTKLPTVNKEYMEREGIPQSASFFPDEEADILSSNNGAYHYSSPYGLLRSPYNYNPSEQTIRYNNINMMSFKGIESERALKPYKGSNCNDLKGFLNNYVKGKNLQSFLKGIELNAHSEVHFTFGGAGGKPAEKVDKILKEKYGLSSTHLLYVAASAHMFAMPGILCLYICICLHLF